MIIKFLIWAFRLNHIYRPKESEWKPLDLTNPPKGGSGIKMNKNNT